MLDLVKMGWHPSDGEFCKSPPKGPVPDLPLPELMPDDPSPPSPGPLPAPASPTLQPVPLDPMLELEDENHNAEFENHNVELAERPHAPNNKTNLCKHLFTTDYLPRGRRACCQAGTNCVDAHSYEEWLCKRFTEDSETCPNCSGAKWYCPRFQQIRTRLEEQLPPDDFPRPAPVPSTPVPVVHRGIVAHVDLHRRIGWIRSLDDRSGTLIEFRCVLHVENSDFHLNGSQNKRVSYELEMRDRRMERAVRVQLLDQQHHRRSRSVDRDDQLSTEIRRFLRRYRFDSDARLSLERSTRDIQRNILQKAQHTNLFEKANNVSAVLKSFITNARGGPQPARGPRLGPTQIAQGSQRRPRSADDLGEGDRPRQRRRAE